MPNYQHVYKLHIGTIEQDVVKHILEDPELAAEIYRFAHYFGIPVSNDRIQERWHYAITKCIKHNRLTNADVFIERFHTYLAQIDGAGGNESDDE